MKNRNKLIVGSAFSLAAIMVAIDHTQHSLPEPIVQENIVIEDDNESPCSMSDDSSPCGLGD